MSLYESRDMMRFIGITKDATTAGPGKRLELFLKGCIRGIVNPCEGCFNPQTWEFGGHKKEMNLYEVVDLIDRDAWNRQVTFCGGEPLLQTRNLIKVCRMLKERDPSFHIVVYTAYTLENLLNNGIMYRLRPEDGEDVKEALIAYSSDVSPDKNRFLVARNSDIRELMKHIDLLVDGDYQADKRIPTELYMNDGMFVGSYNQRVIDTQATLLRDPQFVFLYADQYQAHRMLHKHCKTCGTNLPSTRRTYCSDLCKKRYALRKSAHPNWDQ